MLSDSDIHFALRSEMNVLNRTHRATQKVRALTLHWHDDSVRTFRCEIPIKLAI